MLIFTYAVKHEDSGMEKHVFEESIIVKASRQITYECYSTPVDIQENIVPRTLHKISMLPDILKKFKDLRMCKGITTVDTKFLSGNVDLKSCIGTDSRHKDCSLISINYERCSTCRKYSKTLAQKVKRMKIKDTQRVSACTNPLDRMKLKSLQKKIEIPYK